MQRWLHGHGITLRAEISYELPFEISIPGKYVDGIETESLEFASQLEPYRHLAGPAHLFGKIYSSETGATMLNYQLGLEFYTQIIYTQFAAGVSKTVLHGYSCCEGSEASTAWPGHEGMLPLFSERFGPRQPAFRHYKDWTTMLARSQMILHQGKPRMDLGILRLDYNFNNMYMTGGNEKLLYEHQMMRGHEGVYWQDMGLQDAGYTWDYFAPQILEDESIICSQKVVAPDGPGYQALIIYQEMLPLSSARQILAWAEQGLPVFLVNNVTERVRLQEFVTHGQAASRTPFNSEEEDALADVIIQLKNQESVCVIDRQTDLPEALAARGIRPRAAFSEPNSGILTCLREDHGTFYLFVYNYMYAKPEPNTVLIEFNAIGKPYRVDCWAGKTQEIALYNIAEGKTFIPLTLQPGESTFIMLDTTRRDEFFATEADGCEVIIRNGVPLIVVSGSGECRVQFNGGTTYRETASSPEEIVFDQMHLVIEDWNEGEKKTIIEERVASHVTRRFITKRLLHRSWSAKPRSYLGKTSLPSESRFPESAFTQDLLNCPATGVKTKAHCCRLRILAVIRHRSMSMI